jgi:hypothetical protein
MFDDERHPQNPGGDRQETPGRGKPGQQDTGRRPGQGQGGGQGMPGRGSQDQPDKSRGTPGNPRPEDREREEEKH